MAASLMSLMQAAVQPMAGPSPSPAPPSGGSIALTPDEVSGAIAAAMAGGNSSGGSTSVPTPTTRARNATPGQPSVDNPLVYWGTRPSRSVLSGVPAATGEGHGSVQKVPGGDHQLTIEQAANQVFTWNSAKVKEMTDKLTKAGFKISSFDDLKSAWQSVVSRAAGMYSVSNGKNKVTPEDVISMSSAENAAAFGGSGSGSGSPSTVSSVNRTVNTITAGDGWNALQNTLSRMLGRDPTDTEVRDFVGRMNHLAAAHPSITSSTTTGIGTPQQNTTSTQTQAGFNANDVLQNAYQDAQANPDYAEHQAATTYFNSALSALGQIGA